MNSAQPSLCEMGVHVVEPESDNQDILEINLWKPVFMGFLSSVNPLSDERHLATELQIVIR